MTASNLAPHPPMQAGWSPRLWGLLLVLSGNMLIDALEVSMGVIALPSIGSGLHLRLASLQWVISGFALGFGGLLLFGGRLTSRLGRRRVYLAAVLVFAVASVLGAVAGNGVLLVATRVVKGGCAALTAPTGLAIIAAAFPEGPARSRAVSTYSFIGACGFAAGLLLSGLLTGLSWRWTFLFPAPVALGLFLAGLRFIPGDAGSPSLQKPLLSRGLLSNRPLVRSALGAAALNGSHWGFLLILTVESQWVLGWSPLRTALAIAPASLMLAASTPVTARLMRRFGPARLIAAGAVAPPAGYAVYLAAGPAYATGMLPAIVLVGVGFSLSFAALHAQAISEVPAPSRGMASAAYQTSVQFGGALVLTIVAALGQRPALLVLIGVAVAGLIVALTSLNQAPSPREGRTPP